MAESGGIYLLLYYSSIIASLLGAILAFRKRNQKGRIALTVCLASQALWSLMYILELQVNNDLIIVTILATLKYAPTIGTLCTYAIFSFYLTGLDTLLPRLWLNTILATAAFFLLIILTDPWHHLIWGRAQLVHSGPFITLVRDHNAFYWVFLAWAYSMIMLATIALFQKLIRSRSVFRKQDLLFLLSLLAPWFGNILTVFRLMPLSLDYTTIFLTISDCALVFGLSRYRILDLMPIAKDVVLDIIPDTVVVLDSALRIIDLNIPAATFLSVDRNAVLGKSAHEVFPQFLAEVLKSPIAMERIVENSADEQNSLWYRLRLMPLLPDNLKETGWLILCSDITLARVNENKLRFLATHDTLTGLYNRTRFEEEVSRLTNGRMNSIGVIMIDIDGLKKVNDRDGHAAGDKLIVRAAEAMLKTFRNDDMIARIGGDEFAALLPAIDLVALEKRRSNLLSYLRTINRDPSEPLVELSIGLALASSSSEIRLALARADSLMYAEKRQHRENGTDHGQ